MTKKSQAENSGDPLDNPSLWKVEPGMALGPFRLGMPREEVFQVLKDQNFETSQDDLDDHELYVMEMDVTLYFAEQSPNPILLIEAEDERVRFGTLTVLWQYVHNIFSTIPATDTLWFDDLELITDPHASPSDLKKFTDDDLLNSGIVWITPLGVGFRLASGMISSLYLCDPSNLPQTGKGQFTGAQRHLSEKMQVSGTKPAQAKSHPLEQVFKLGLLVAALCVGGFFAKQAWNEQQRWDNAPEVEADVVAVSPPPPEPFPEKFQLRYTDNFGEAHEVELGNNDVYGIPKVGDKIAVRYLLEAPGVVKGPAKLHDIGFDRFVPYLIATFGIYVTLHFFSDFIIGRFLRPKP